MAAERVDYLELYVTDTGRAVDHFVGSFGFSVIADAGPHTGLADRRSVVLRRGVAHVVVTSPAQAGDAVAAFLDRHGDGVADIALSCVDVAAAYERATAHGATGLAAPGAMPCAGRDTLVARVSGFGDTVHTLVQRPPGQPATLPPGSFRTLTPFAERGTTDGWSIDHLAVCVPAGTLQATADHYGAAFGLRRYSAEYIEVGGQAMDSVVVRDDSGAVTLTLIEPDSAHQRGQIDDFLDAHGGAGVQHVAFAVSDVVGAVRRMRERGVEFLRTPGAYYDLLQARVGHLTDEIADLREAQVLVDRDEWGHLLQIFTSSPYPRRTLFFELIQRRGAQGFGSANIRALYEAVERERAPLLGGA